MVKLGAVKPENKQIQVLRAAILCLSCTKRELERKQDRGIAVAGGVEVPYWRCRRSQVGNAARSVHKSVYYIKTRERKTAQFSFQIKFMDYTHR